MNVLLRFVAAATLTLLSLCAGTARADEPAAAPTESIEKARSEFVAGATAVQNAQWGEALASFERSAALRPHSLTTYNIGVCERALGKYTRARMSLRAAQKQNETAGGGELPSSYADEAKAYLVEIDKLLAHAELFVMPEDAAIAVDGRPLEMPSERPVDAMPLVLVAGVVAAGPGKLIPQSRFELELDPGAHVLTLSRRGYADVLVNKTFAPGSRSDVKLVLDRLPASLRIRAERDGAVVKVDGSDVGIAPVDVSRPAGSYAVVVTKRGFDTYRTRVTVRAGEEADLLATMSPETVPLTQKWWFWTAAGVVLAGAAIATYAIAQPTPDRPATEGGGLGWVAKVSGP